MFLEGVKMKYLVSFIILLLFTTDINGRSKRTTESQWFRDRHGNSIEISDFTARFSKAKTSETVPVSENCFYYIG